MIMSCKTNHSNLKNVTFCEECGEKLNSNWNCSCGHTNESKHNFCLKCGVDSKVVSVKNRNAFVPNSVNSNSMDNSNFERDNDTNQNFYTPNPKSNQSKIIFIVLGAFFTLGIFAIFINQVLVVKTTLVTVTNVLLDQECYDISWGYSDVPGAQVVLTADGEEVGFGYYADYGQSTYLGCEFTAYIYDVPMNAESYAIEMASGRRGVVYNSREDLESNDWTFSLSIG
jgi:hypothetical protein